MSNTDIYHTAKQIMETINESMTPIGVFRVQGEVLAMPAIGRKFDMMFRDCRKGFIGVYDKNCKIEMIKEDLV